MNRVGQSVATSHSHEKVRSAASAFVRLPVFVVVDSRVITLRLNFVKFRFFDYIVFKNLNTVAI